MRAVVLIGALALLPMAPALAGGPGGAATSQPSPSPVGEEAEPTVSSVWARVVRAYREAAVVERLRIAVRSGSAEGPVTRQTLTVRTAPAEGDEQPDRVWVRAGLMLAMLEGARLRVAADRAESPWVEMVGKSGPDVLRESLPPLPVPQIDLLLRRHEAAVDGDAAAGISQLTPYATRVRWETLRIDRRAVSPGGSGLMTLAGRHEHGPIELQCESPSGRLRRLVIRRDRPGEAFLELTIEAAAVGDSGALFEIDAQESRRADSIAALLREIRAGERAATDFDFARIIDADGMPMRPPEAQGQHGPIRRPALIAALRWARPDSPEAPADEQLVEARAWLRAAASVLDDPAFRDTRVALVVVGRLQDQNAAVGHDPSAESARLRALAESVGPGMVAGAGWVRSADWPAWASADGAEPVFVLVDQRGRGVGVLTLAGDAGSRDLDALRRDLRDAITELQAAPDPTAP